MAQPGTGKDPLLQPSLVLGICTGLPTGFGLAGRVGCAARFMKCSTIVPCLHVQTTAFPRLACELPASSVVLIARRLPVFIARRPPTGIHPSDKLEPWAQR